MSALGQKRTLTVYTAMAAKWQADAGAIRLLQTKARSAGLAPF